MRLSLALGQGEGPKEQGGVFKCRTKELARASRHSWTPCILGLGRSQTSLPRLKVTFKS